MINTRRDSKHSDIVSKINLHDFIGWNSITVNIYEFMTDQNVVNTITIEIFYIKF